MATTGPPGFDYESATSHDIIVEATSTDGSKSNATFAIMVNDVDEFDVGPTMDTDNGINEVDENATGGTVGITALATDADGTNNTVTYQLTDSASGRFAIDTNTGVVSVESTGSPGFDYESATSHDIVVEATSTDGSKLNAAFAIAVKDIDEVDVGATTDSDGNNNEVDEDATSGVVGVTALATDADGSNNTVTYQLTNNAGGRFAIDTNTGIVSVVTTGSPGLDYESATSHDITVEATSTDGSKSNATFAIAVNDVDEVDVGPITDADNSANEIDENAASGIVGISALATDSDGTNNTVTYQLTDNAGGRFAIDTNTGVVSVATTGSPGFDYESATSHDIIVEATSADGSKSNATFAIAVNDVDEFDVGPATDSDGNNNEVDENATSGTVGITALTTDADGTNNTITYQLTDSAGGRFAIDTNTGVVSVTATGSPGFDYESATSHDIVVEATSTDGSKSNATFAIAVNDVDEFDVGPSTDTDNGINEVDENATGGTVGITAHAADADGTNNTVSYQLTDSASGRFAIDTNTGVVSVATTGSPGFDYESATSHDIIVEATSTDGSKSNATFAIALNDVDEVDVGPVTDADNSTNEIDENATSGTVGITALATDADGTNNTVTYRLTDSASGRFVIDTNTGAVAVATTDSPGFDHESSTSHTITIEAESADGSISDASFSVAVRNVNDNAPVIASGQSFNVNENAINGTVVGIVLATDQDTGTTLSGWRITAGNDAGAFDIDAETGEITVANGFALDYETEQQYALSVVVSDGSNSAIVEVVLVDVSDVNERPVFTSGEAFDVAENSVAVTTLTSADVDSGSLAPIYTVSGGADAAKFEIVSTDQLQFVEPPNFETKLDADGDGVYVVEIQVDDGAGGTATQKIEVTVTNVNEAAVFSSEPVRTVDEDSIYRYQITTEDVDGQTPTISGSVLPTWLSLSDNGDGTAVLAGTPTNGEVGDHLVELQVFDGTRTSVQSFTITVINSNDAPSLVAPFSIRVIENESRVGAVGATDDEDDTLTFSITGGADASFFDINAANGALSFRQAPNFEEADDRNQDNRYELDISVTDSNGAQSTRSFAIQVTDVNEAPILKVFELVTSPGFAGEIGSLQIFDPDTDDQVDVRITGGTGAAAFQLDPQSGRVTQITPLEAGSYTLDVRLTDSRGASIDGVLMITVALGDSAAPVENGGIGSGQGVPTIVAPPQPVERESASPEPIVIIPSATAVTAAEQSQTLSEQGASVTASIPANFWTPISEGVLNRQSTEVNRLENTESNSRESRGMQLNIKLLLDGFAPYAGQYSDSNMNEFILYTNDGVPSPALGRAFDRIGADINEMNDAEMARRNELMTTGTALSVSMTAGFVTWLLSAGSLLATAATTSALWSRFDPIPVLVKKREEREAEDVSRLSTGSDDQAERLRYHARRS